MMVFSIILLTISFLLQGIVSNVFGYLSSDLTMMYTIYLLLTLLIIYPHFENKKKYFLLLVIFGVLMDIVYSNTLIFNICLFFVVYKLSKLFHFFFPYNYLTINISNLLGIYLYNIITYLFLILLDFDNYSVNILMDVLVNSTFMTIIYTTFICWLVSFIKQKFDLKEVK